MGPRIPIEIVHPRLTAPELDLPRFGLIALGTDLTVERDAARLIRPDEGIVHVSRIRFENPTTPENLCAMRPNIAAAAALLVPGVELAAVAFACTSASVTIRNDVVAGAIAQARPGVPVITPSSAGLAALKTLGVQRIALLTSYLPETTAPMVTYFQAGGMTVERCACFGLADDRDMARLDREALIQTAASLDGSNIDALFLSCTAMPALDVIDAIETQIGKPVVSSNQATFWAMRGLASLSAPVAGLGRLLQYPAPDQSVWAATVKLTDRVRIEADQL
ncbi:ectoine utilization protein EutA [Thioclava sp.]|uniref:aspartate racemase/maleate isomerase family protein n=1 Tax=Thioclava sp. TaxID=1933450 RepID=UPI003AA913BC